MIVQLQKMKLPTHLYNILLDKLLPIGVFLPDISLDEAYFDLSDFSIKPYYINSENFVTSSQFYD